MNKEMLFATGGLLVLSSVVSCDPGVSPDKDNSLEPEKRSAVAVLGENIFNKPLEPWTWIKPSPLKVVEVPHLSESELRVQRLNPNLRDAFLNNRVPECEKDNTTSFSLRPMLESVKSFVVQLITPRIAEAASLEVSQAPENFLKCLKAVDAKFGYLESKGVNVSGLTEDNILGLKSIASWRTDLASELKAKGYDTDPGQINNLVGEKMQVAFVDRNGKLAQFPAIILDNKAEVDVRRARGEVNVHWSGEIVGVILDKKTNKVIVIFEECTNYVIYQMDVSPLEVPVPTSTPKPETTPTPPAPIIPSATKEANKTPTPSATGTPTSTPTGIPTPTSTPTFSPTEIPTPTPTATPYYPSGGRGRSSGGNSGGGSTPVAVETVRASATPQTLEIPTPRATATVRASATPQTLPRSSATPQTLPRASATP